MQAQHRPTQTPELYPYSCGCTEMPACLYVGACPSLIHVCIDACACWHVSMCLYVCMCMHTCMLVSLCYAYGYVGMHHVKCWSACPSPLSRPFSSVFTSSLSQPNLLPFCSTSLVPGIRYSLLHTQTLPTPNGTCEWAFVYFSYFST